MIQGYEHFGLNNLLNGENIDKNDIITSRSKVPEVWWIDMNGKTHRYYIDIFIKSQNRGVEIKSNWTYESDQENVLLKRKAFIEAGYKCDIWVFDNKGKRIMYNTLNN